MDLNPILLYFDNDFNLYNKIFDICTKLKINIVLCSNICEFVNIFDHTHPKFVVINKLKKEDIDNIMKFVPKNSFVYNLYNNKIDNYDNLFHIQNINSLEQQLQIHCCNKELEMIYYNLISRELNNLSFKSKLIGAKYLIEVIYYFYINNLNSKFTCNTIFSILADKYNSKPACIERNIRFSILNAYTASKNKQLFFEISKKLTIPSIKEIAKYFSEKLKLTTNI